MELKFQTFPILPPLRGFIEKIWLFESPGKLPVDDLKLIVPNGRPLLLVPYRNALVGKMAGKEFISAENKIILIGGCDRPALVDSKTDAPTGSLGIEFSPFAIYRFFHIHLGEIRNEANFLTTIPGHETATIEASISGSDSPEEKVNLLQSWLLYLFNKKEEDTLFDYCIKLIEKTCGNVTIKQLEKITGYSSRWLNCKFDERLGLSPKNFSSIIRFQHYYKAAILETRQFKIKRPYYDQFYDQSHFIKDFKRFTGMTPSKLVETENKFGRLFY